MFEAHFVSQDVDWEKSSKVNPTGTLTKIPSWEIRAAPDCNSTPSFLTRKQLAWGNTRSESQIVNAILRSLSYEELTRYDFKLCYFVNILTL